MNPSPTVSLTRRLGLVLPLLALFGCGGSSGGGDGDAGGPGFNITQPPTVNYFTPPEGYAVGYSMLLEPGVTQNPKKFQLISGVLPPGIEFDTKTGAFSGRPLVAGNTVMGVRATNSKGFADTGVGLLFTPPPAARFLYVAGTDADVLSVYHVDDSSGVLSNASFVSTGDEPSVVVAAPGGRHVAVGTSAGGSVAIFAIHPMNGRPTEVAGSPTALGSAVIDVAFDPGLESLYVLAAADGVQDLLHVFSFNEFTGALTSTPAPPLPVPDGSTALAADPLGRAVYVTHGDGLRTWVIDPDGLLIDMGDLNTLDSFQDVAVLPGGSVVFAVNESQQDVYRFPVTPSGLLVAGTFAGDLAGSAPAGLAISGDGANLYTADATGSINQFSVNPGGFLAALTPPSVSAGGAIAGLATSPSGAGAWVTRGGAVNDIVSLSAAAGGALTAELELPVRAYLDPRALALAPALSPVVKTTKNLFAVNSDNDDFNQFAIGLGGIMGPLFPPIMATGSEPVSVLVHPNREALYVCNAQDTARAVEAFAISVNGQSTPLQQFSASAGAKALVLAGGGDWGHVVLDDVDDSILTVSVSVSGTLSTVGTDTNIPVTGRPAGHPNGRWLYVPDGAAGTISTYSVSATDGSLTLVGSPTATDLGVNAVAVDPTGRLLYAVNSGAVTDQVRGFAIHATDGSLSELSTSPYAFDATAKEAIDVVAHPSGRYLYVATQDNTSTAGEGSIHVYSIEVGSASGAAFGGLTLQGSPTTFPMEDPSDIEVDAAGTTLYVAIEKVMGRVEAYSLDAGGALSGAPIDVEDSGAMTHAMALKSRSL